MRFAIIPNEFKPSKMSSSQGQILKKKIVRNESIFKPEKLLNEICHDVVEIETETICFIANAHQMVRGFTKIEN